MFSSEDLLAKLIVLVILITVPLIITIRFRILNSRRKKQHEAEIARLKDEHQSDIAAEIYSQEKAMQFITHELHDNTGQMLTLLRLYLASLYPHLPPSQAETNKLVDELTDKIIRDLRVLTRSLEPQYIRGKFSDKIKEQAESIEEAERCEISLEVAGIETELHPEKEVILFRIIQRILYNALKHPKPTIKMGLYYSELGLSVIIRENCKEPDHTLGKTVNETELRNLKHRTSFIGGEISFYQDSYNGDKYTTTEIRVPKSSL